MTAPEPERVPVRCASCRWTGRRLYRPGRAAAACPSCASTGTIQRRALNTHGPGHRWARWPGRADE